MPPPPSSKNGLMGNGLKLRNKSQKVRKSAHIHNTHPDTLSY